MHRLRTFDEYWKERAHPSANEAWEICSHERDEVIKDLRKDFKFVLTSFKQILDLGKLDEEDRILFSNWIDEKWKDWKLDELS